MLYSAKQPISMQRQTPVTTTSSPCNSATTLPDNFKESVCNKRVAILSTLPIIRPPLPPAHELLPEWIETDSIDGEISQLVSNQQTSPVAPSTTPNNNQNSRRCCKNSISSGYSSHSPQLSATSFSVPVSTTNSGCQHNNQIVNGTSKPLAPIREGEIIPRPIWPMSPSDDSLEENSSPDTASSDDAGRGTGRKGESLYGSAGYRSSCEASSSEYGAVSNSSSAVSAREVLLELSRTLSSVLEGDCDKSDEEILRDITRTVTVAQSAGRRPSSSLYEEIYKNNTAGSLASSARESTSTIGVNPINSRLYGQRCYCEKSFFCQSRRGSINPSPKISNRKDQCIPSVFLLPNEHTKSFFQGIDNGFTTCSCKNYFKEPDKLTTKKSAGSKARNQNDARPNYPIVEHEYTTLECSDECSSSSQSDNSGSKTSTWCNKDFRGFDKNLDFTLDGLRAERLGRAIARAKKRRRCCCVFLIIFGLAFFILVVVVVSLGVTKGRKVFGSM